MLTKEERMAVLYEEDRQKKKPVRCQSSQKGNWHICDACEQIERCIKKTA